MLKNNFLPFEMSDNAEFLPAHSMTLGKNCVSVLVIQAMEGKVMRASVPQNTSAPLRVMFGPYVGVNLAPLGKHTLL
jgi:hypothetical protein